MVLMAGAVGFCLCLFTADAHGTLDHGMSPDLCAGLAVFSVAVSLVVFAQLNQVPVDSPYVVYAVPRHLVDPPPKAPALS
jgi:hypothetical protein